MNRGLEARAMSLFFHQQRQTAHLNYARGCLEIEDSGGSYYVSTSLPGKYSTNRFAIQNLQPLTIPTTLEYQMICITKSRCSRHCPFCSVA